MKYRTIIEIISEANDPEEASNMAGEYLRGKMDFGVAMKCRTTKLWEHKAVKYTLCSAMGFVMLLAVMMNVTPLGGEETVRESSALGVGNTFTLMPALKTKHKAGFRKEWQDMREEVANKYIKK
ncbi:MAG: hypothetical protein PHW14_01860 [Candidatus Omnitrophica bacterium]|nr:hypothetical protein [Candidatus Omnitrophota bacterium]